MERFTEWLVSDSASSTLFAAGVLVFVNMVIWALTVFGAIWVAQWAGVL